MLTGGDRTLIIGYGNTACGDDALGVLCADRVGELNLEGVDTISRIQLVVEDAMEIGNYRQVVFIDASVNCSEPFELVELREKRDIVFDTHSISPDVILKLARSLFEAESKACLLAIRGYVFDRFTETCSDQALANLQKAVDFLQQSLNSPTSN